MPCTVVNAAEHIPLTCTIHSIHSIDLYHRCTISSPSSRRQQSSRQPSRLFLLSAGFWLSARSAVLRLSVLPTRASLIVQREVCAVFALTVEAHPREPIVPSARSARSVCYHKPKLPFCQDSKEPPIIDGFLLDIRFAFSA